MIRIKRIHHVQICIPVGEEEKGREFYGGILGFKEIPKPDSLKGNGGMWYQSGNIELHIGVEPMGREHSKRHPAFEVGNLEEVRRYLEERGVRTLNEKPIPNWIRFSFFDPFGNRIEFLERVNDAVHVESEKVAVQSQFGRSAEAYVTSEVHAKGKDLSKLVEISQVTSSDYVLDVATGGGHVANALAPLAAKVTALDLTPEMLEAARRFIEGNGHLNVEFIQGDAEQLPFSDNVFDIVTCRIAPHHFPNVERFIEEVFRVLKPGGRFLLADNVAPEEDEADRIYNEIEKRRDYSHYRAWKKSEWLRMLEDKGFTVEEWHRFSKTFPFDSWCDRMNLSEEKKQDLTRFMLNVPEKIRQRLRIVCDGDKIISFQGDSILLKAVKQEV